MDGVYKCVYVQVSVHVLGCVWACAYKCVRVSMACAIRTDIKLYLAVHLFVPISTETDSREPEATFA